VNFYISKERKIIETVSRTGQERKINSFEVFFRSNCKPYYLMFRTFLTASFFYFSFNCSAQAPDYTQYADPIVGTGGHGHTFPGAVMPFGMVQLSPDTRLSGWDGCSGYHYSDNKIYGFSHTHLSGTGCSDYGDVLLMPGLGKPKFNHKRYCSYFSHANEKASPGYYSVLLDKYGIKAELTVTLRTGLHKYIFPQSKAANIILDLNHRDRLKHGEINIVGNNEITGMRLSSIWADSQYVYFVIRFSKPFKQAGILKNHVLKNHLKQAAGHHLKAYASFETKAGEAIYVQVGLSTVSIEGAIRNLEAEQPSIDFDKVKNAAKASWNKEFSKIEIQSRDTIVMRTFYSAMYHAMIPPILNQDVDGKYRGRDLQIHETKNFTYYTASSIWDSYRALHPLITLIDQKRTSDFVNSFMVAYKQRGLLPVWDLSSCETWGMIGYHVVSVINDAYQKGVTGFDTNEALEAMKHSATITRKGLNKYFKMGPLVTMASFYRYAVGWDDYQKLGYIRCRRAIESVSKTLEYAYDDWCIAQMANKLGKTDDYNFFIKRASNYKNLLDSNSGFMRPRQKKFIHVFDPYAVTINYTEANAWQYSFYVPQDISGQMQMMGGKQKLATLLDSLFNTTSKLRGLPEHDITGMIGQYAHGNEPSHQIIYEYDYVGQPWKAQALTRKVMNELYRPEPDGLSGNEDCGQMSAWYILSALGFYPVCPGSNQYALGSPLVDKAVIHFENGKGFTITAEDNRKENVYIQSATMNGNKYSKCFVTYEDLMKGGNLEFKMGAVPNKAWGSGESEIPVSKIE
jgi:predicted alpha-1,2-mannosidase